MFSSAFQSLQWRTQEFFSYGQFTSKTNFSYGRLWAADIVFLNHWAISTQSLQSSINHWAISSQAMGNSPMAPLGTPMNRYHTENSLLVPSWWVWIVSALSNIVSIPLENRSLIGYTVTLKTFFLKFNRFNG